MKRAAGSQEDRALLPVPQAAGSAHRAMAGPMSGLGGGSGSAVRAEENVAGVPPLALYGKVGNGYRIEAVCQGAEALGLVPGVSLAEARARFPGLEILEGEVAEDRRLLDHIADWCDRYTPLVALDGPCGLVLDISGCAHLFGGETALCDDLLRRLHGQGFAASVAIASSAAAARALSTHAPGSNVPAGGEAAAIAPLPVAALRLEPEVRALLFRLGLKRIGDLLVLPRAGLARRFGKTLMERIDEAAGRSERPISPRLPVPLLIHERRLFEPIARQEDILAILAHLAARLAHDLERRCEGGRRFELALFRVDGAVTRLVVGTSAPLRDPQRLERLFRERLKAVGDEVDAGFGFDLVRLTALQAGAVAARQGDFGEAGEAAEDVVTLIDRLAARLGEVAVFGLEAVERHRPERAQARRPAGLATAMNGGARSGTGPASPRPLRLLDRPEPVEATAAVPEGAPEQFRWRRALHRVQRVEGPERIAPEWWRGDAAPGRDYWRVEDEDGRRYWLFREGGYDLLEPENEGELEDERAQVEAIAEDGRDYAPPDAGPPRPAWYVHGIFA